MGEQPAPAWHRCGGHRAEAAPAITSTSVDELVASAWSTGTGHLCGWWLQGSCGCPLRGHGPAPLSVPRLVPFPGLSLMLAMSLSLSLPSVEHA